MPKPSRWTQEKRYEIVMETVRGKESISAIARKHQVSDALIHRWRERFFEGGRAVLAMDGGDKYRSLRGMTDYQRQGRGSASAKHNATLRCVALERPEAGHCKVRQYAIAWGQ